MYKDEMIQVHQFLVYMLKYLIDDEEIEKNCKDYISLKINPHHIHRTKAEHKKAIFVLCKTISEVVANKDPGSIPPNVSNTLDDLIKRTEKEINYA
ncbi:UPF0058 family protein [Methanobrevibacter sp. DSM 116169]|uniref:UPF0058 family protein n=1 Tax=Methanobrevibacter sp. DSM 116169 TaxID=3242727 RepID=UPI0038FBFB2E